jgi:hypothetical protein
MARQGDRRTPKQHDLVERLVPDPSQPADVTVLVGFLGKSAQAGTWRLYIAPDLSEYLEFPEESVRHTEDVKIAQSALPRTAVWVDRNANIVHNRSERQPYSDFLRGEIATTFMARADIGSSVGRPLRTLQGGFESVPPRASVCLSCPTEGGEDTCVPATCTLSTACRTQFLCL